MTVQYNFEFVLFILTLSLSSILYLKRVYSMKSAFYITLNQSTDVFYESRQITFKLSHHINEKMRRIVIFIL